MPVPLELFNAASKPTAVLLDAVFKPKAAPPIAVLLEPVEFTNNEFLPKDVLFPPVVFDVKDAKPTAVFLIPVLAFNAW
jgi:hypothetical protein